MPDFQYSIVGSGEQSTITVFSPRWTEPQVAHDDHPQFQDIFDAVMDDETTADELADLFSTEKVVAEHFQQVSERIAIKDGHVYLDGDLVDSALTKAILGFLNEGVADWQPLVNFFEKVQANPQEHSREQLYEWLDRRDFAITRDGDLVGYKGVTSNGNGGYVSLHSGRAIVDGSVVTGRIPNAVGSVIEMPRSEVNHDPSIGCHTGLHVGTYDFAQSYANSGVMMKVLVNPRDVVSVPTDANAAKVRVCRYYVDSIVTYPVASYYDEDVEGGWDEDEDEWGDGEGWDED